MLFSQLSHFLALLALGAGGVAGSCGDVCNGIRTSCDSASSCNMCVLYAVHPTKGEIKICGECDRRDTAATTCRDKNPNKPVCIHRRGSLTTVLAPPTQTAQSILDAMHQPRHHQQNVFELARLAPGRPAPPARQNLSWEHITVAGARTVPESFLFTEERILQA
ncbi:hypothetical protein C8R47DRAFT_1082478 [Mycena vitilis]|nr:hypothetical protein C8R47DRAFT_1082478 [Mycena vitilis]